MELALLKIARGPLFGLPSAAGGADGRALGTPLPAALVRGAGSGVAERSVLVDRLPALRKHMKGCGCSGIAVESDADAVTHTAREIAAVRSDGGGAASSGPDAEPRYRFVMTQVGGLHSALSDALAAARAVWPTADGGESGSVAEGAAEESVSGQQSDALPSVELSAEAEAAALRRLDSQLDTLWRAARPNTLLLVCSLGGDTATVRWLHSIRSMRQRAMEGSAPAATGSACTPRWTLACEDALNAVADRAICGCFWAAVKG